METFMYSARKYYESVQPILEKCGLWCEMQDMFSFLSIVAGKSPRYKIILESFKHGVHRVINRQTGSFIDFLLYREPGAAFPVGLFLETSVVKEEYRFLKSMWANEWRFHCLFFPVYPEDTPVYPLHLYCEFESGEQYLLQEISNFFIEPFFYHPGIKKYFLCQPPVDDSDQSPIECEWSVKDVVAGTGHLMPYLSSLPKDFIPVEWDKILNDALLSRRYSIQENAIVEVGEWICRIGSDHACKGQADGLRHIRLSFSPSVHYQARHSFFFIYPIDVSFFFDPVQIEMKKAFVSLATKTPDQVYHIFTSLGACIIRDFWVADMVEYQQKEKVVSEVVGTKKKKGREKKVWKKRKQVIYLPRKEVVFGESKSRSVVDRQYVQISPHTVRGHLRRLAKPHWKASEQAIDNAAEFGMNLRDGYTFVKPHKKGEVEQLRTYRSKSALQLLYGK